ncbi:GGDEF domain-containing protein [Methylobacillus gramineus]|uniref:GGDEF domain-containing protein n=1 Tax=Methylobacillus gramineus TaxID=755169 RepID=UPI001CFFE1DF|nr:GGDEF domain-containing protein [Methylobacillus gramineus]MCB5185832.1 GGDEF domain-containing protein [Methylobacillus gramineus]
MQQSASSIDIARQTLMQLASRKIQPTPDNFRTVYDEIAGVKSADSSVDLANTLNDVLVSAGQQSPKYSTAAQSVKQSIESRNWPKLAEQLGNLLPVSSAVDEGVSWPATVRNLLKQLDMSHKGVTLTRKREGLNRLLSKFEHDEALPQKMQSLINSWGSSNTDDLEIMDTMEGSASAPANAVTGPGEANREPAREYYARVSDYWRDMLMRTLNLIIIPQLSALPEVAQKAEALLADIKLAYSEEDVLRQGENLKSILFTLEMHGDSQHRMHEALLQLLRLSITSMSELVMEDKWLHGQTLILRDILSRPMNLDMLFDAESSFKELIFKQGQIKPRLIDARDAVKKMAEIFIMRLTDMTESTSEYQSKIDVYKQKITETEDILELNKLIDSMMEDTRNIGLNIRQSREMLSETQLKVVEAERLIDELTSKLDYFSEVAHEDYLTGTLNRRGMEEALEREFDRADRHATQLSLAMMDIDHFKKLNDKLGHATGDKALVHLAKIIKESLRTTDVLARYGGEEFIIILPGTGESEAIDIVKRSQRELTRSFFMHKNERVLITFSAGVAERQSTEPAADLVPRADAALYKAKQSGRNRVIGAGEQEP